MRNLLPATISSLFCVATMVPVAQASGLSNVTASEAPGLPVVRGSAVAWADYNNDGLLDFIITGYSDTTFGGVSQLWRNTGSGFTNVTSTAAPGLPGLMNSFVSWGDYDNDGYLDLFISGYNQSSGVDSSQLWRNTNGVFSDVTASAFPSTFFHGLYGLSGSFEWGDYDNDGRLDGFFTGYRGGKYVSWLWRNTGSRFTNVTASVAPGLPGVVNSSLAWGDYDNDGRLDFFIAGGANSGNVAQLWRNTGTSFTNVTPSVMPGLEGMVDCSAAWGDYDNDGRLDLILTGRNGANLRISQLWRNLGTEFSNVTATTAPGLLGVSEAPSLAWNDYDNDGRIDFLLMGSTGSSRICQLWRNTGSGFDNVISSVAPGLPKVLSSSIAWGDYDNDSRLDLLITGKDELDQNVSQLWRNMGTATNTKPTAPNALTVAATGDGLTFSWGAASDSETPSNGLAYHLRVGTTPGGSDLYAPMAAPDGWARLPRGEALRPARSRTLIGLPNNQSIYWSVQATDTALAGSPFATEQVLTLAGVPISPNGSVTPGDTNGDGAVSQAEFAEVRAALSNELSMQNAAGYYTEAQVQSLNVTTPLLGQVSPGRFRLTLGVQRSTNLSPNSFADLSLATPNSFYQINPQGKLEFDFPSTNNAAFFRIKTE